MSAPLTDAEIAGFMNWRGPGAYTAGAMRKVRAAVAEAARREREACAQVVEANYRGVYDGPTCAAAIRARGQS